MRYIELVGPIPPRKQTALNRRINIVNNKASISDKKEYIKKTNTWGLLKKWLSDLSDGKCWYCETFSERATADVDHFRPKAGITCDRAEISNHDGYYWLAYEWTNYRYSCQRCNRPEKDADVLYGKHNEFSLCDEKQRKYSAACNNVEKPKLLDPCIEEDTQLLVHLKDGTVAASSQQGTIEYERAAYTCKVLGLNSFGVPKKKKDAWEDLRLLIELVDHHPKVVERLRNKLDPTTTEYSSFFRAAIGSYKDRDWIEALL